MALFFIVFFSVYSAVNYYIFIRGWQALQGHPTFRIVYLTAFLIAALSYIASRMLEKSLPVIIYEALTWIGSFYFAYILYILLFILLFDLLRLGNFFFDYYPAFIKQNYAQAKYIIFWLTVGISSLIIAAGYINTRVLNVTELSISTPKRSSSLEHLRVAMVSDVHLSPINDEKFLGRIVDKINELKPDLVLIPGDLVDDRVHHLKQRGIGESFKRIKARYGIYASMGNHEFINNGYETASYIKGLGINLLRDETALIDNFYLVGRDDSSKSGFTKQSRKTLKEIMGDIENRYPVILLDHTPFRLEEAAFHQVNLQVSGHTHHGQLFPLNFITKIIYEVSRGYWKKENTHYYVSNGVGTWGPPVRTGSLTEIVLINIRFE